MFQIKRTHIISPVCPKCGSNITGRYIQGNFNCSEETRLIYSHYKKGERVRIRSSSEFNNCYCESCGMEWHGHLDKIKCTNEEWKKISDEIELEGKYYKYSLFKKTPKISQKQKELKQEDAKKVLNCIAFFFFGYRFWKKDKRK